MDAPSILAKVRAVVAKTFQIPESDVTAESAIGNLPAWDSFGHMQLMTDLEQAFNVTFPAYQLAELTSVEAIVAALGELLAA